MLSEVDIRDWDRVNPEKAIQSLDNLKYAVGTVAFYDDFYHLKQFIQNVELIRKKQVKQIPVLFTRR